MLAALVVASTAELVVAGEIKLTGRNDLVLSYETRVTVLDVAGRHLSEKDDDFLNGLKSAENPFSFEQTTSDFAGSEEVEAETEPKPEQIVNYDEASVLRVVASSFSEQVRGTLARGTTSFLQLKGGSMIRPGTSFPVSIPQAQGQTFNVTVSEITSTSYTLTLGDAEQTLSLDRAGSSEPDGVSLD